MLYGQTNNRTNFCSYKDYYQFPRSSQPLIPVASYYAADVHAEVPVLLACIAVEWTGLRAASAGFWAAIKISKYIL